MDMDTFNKKAYETAMAVQHFGNDERLQKPEEAILNILKPRLSSMTMLDMGVGAGRTTRAFALLVRQYIGCDYSETMIRECERRFPPTEGNVQFMVCDAADMSMIPDGTVDFLLFSFNGIDVVSEEKRANVFSEVRRVGKPGSFFAFSSHNLLSLRKMLTVQLHRNPRRLWISLRRFLLNRLWNPSLQSALRKEHIIFNEMSHFLRLKHYYIRPDAQVRELKKVEFDHIRLFGLDGREIPKEQWASCIDSWVYYLCRIA